MGEIFILSIVQGISEFIPVSSSSHLIIISEIFNFTNQSFSIDVSLHIGSFIAVIVYFHKVLKGELTVVISPNSNKELLTTDFGKIEKQVTKYLKSYSVKDVVELISKKEKVSKKIVYNICLKLKK